MAGHPLRPDILGIRVAASSAEISPETARVVGVLEQIVRQLEQAGELIEQTRTALAQSAGGDTNIHHLNAVLYHHGDLAAAKLRAGSDYVELLANMIERGYLPNVVETFTDPGQGVPGETDSLHSETDSE